MFDLSDEEITQSLISLLAFDPFTVDHDYVIDLLFPRSTLVNNENKNDEDPPHSKQ